MHTCRPSSEEVESGGLGVQGQPGLQNNKQKPNTQYSKSFCTLSSWAPFSGRTVVHNGWTALSSALPHSLPTPLVGVTPSGGLPWNLSLCLRWKNGILEEIMNAEYVITEVNGITTYSYSLTAATANCRSQPQNWSTFKSDFYFLFEGTLWNREVGGSPPPPPGLPGVCWPLYHCGVGGWRIHFKASSRPA